MKWFSDREAYLMGGGGFGKLLLNVASLRRRDRAGMVLFLPLRGEQLGAQVHLPSPFSRQHRQTEEGQQQRCRFGHRLRNHVRCRCAHAKLIERGSTLSD